MNQVYPDEIGPMILAATRYHAEEHMSARFFGNAEADQIEDYFAKLEDREAGEKPGAKGWAVLARMVGDEGRAAKMERIARARKTVEQLKGA